MTKKIIKTDTSTTSPRAAQVADPLAIDSVDQLKALAHPLRMQLLEQFAVRPKTAKQVAVDLGLQPTRLYHHVAKLERAGLIKLVKTRRVRGTTEKYYSPVSANLRIDRSAFNEQSGKLAGNLLGTGVIDSLLANVQREVSEYLSLTNAGDEGSTAPHASHEEVMFAGAEFEIDAAAVPLYRRRVAQLIEDLEALAQQAKPGESGSRGKYRLVVGWYPRVTRAADTD